MQRPEESGAWVEASGDNRELLIDQFDVIVNVLQDNKACFNLYRFSIKYYDTRSYMYDPQSIMGDSHSFSSTLYLHHCAQVAEHAPRINSYQALQLKVIKIVW